MGAPVVHFEIAAVNAPKLQAFYAELFSWKVDANNPFNYGMVDTGGEGGINGGIFEAPKGEGYLTIYVQVTDMAAQLKRVEDLGGQCVVPPMQIPTVGTTAFIKDPEGNVVGLLQPESA
ncbi:MAG: VOC family protein [Chloroflexota bacterium]